MYDDMIPFCRMIPTTKVTFQPPGYIVSFITFHRPILLDYVAIPLYVYNPLVPILLTVHLIDNLSVLPYCSC